MQREKEIDLTESFDQSPYTNRTIKNQMISPKRHQNFD